MNKVQFLYLFILIVFFTQNATAPAQQLTQNLSKETHIAKEIVQHALSDTIGYHWLRQLSKLGHRLVGSENCLRAVQWAKTHMDSLHLDKVWLQPVMVPKWERGEVESAVMTAPETPKGKHLQIAALGGSVATPVHGITAEVLEVRSFEELQEKADEAKGKIIFFNQPMKAGTINTFSAYSQAVTQRVYGSVEAARAGGIGAIVRSVTTKYDNVPHVGTLAYNDNIIKVPGVSIGLQDADFLSRMLKKYPKLTLHLTLSSQQFPDVQSYNIIGQLTGSEKPNEVIVIGGHFDSWDKGDGSQDDGAGCIQSLEVLNLFQRLGIKPKRTIRAVFYMNEEYGLHGAHAYGKYAEESSEIHIAAIESDRGAATPRGFFVDTSDEILQQMQEWLPLLQEACIEWIRKGGSGADISTLKKAKALIGYVPDIQTYFDFHHSSNDTFFSIHPRSFSLGSAAMAIMAYLLSEQEI